MQTGYANNKDNRGVELERARRAKEQQELTAKRHLQSDIMVKKGFLFSTTTTINMKASVMKQKELRMNAIKTDIRNLEAKEAQIRADKERKNHELEGFQREHDEFQKQIDQLTKDKVRMETEIRKLEMGVR